MSVLLSRNAYLRKLGRFAFDLYFAHDRAWFSHFIQRGFAETYGEFPRARDVRRSVDNLRLVLRLLQSVGPYRDIASDTALKERFPHKYKRYVTKARYQTHYLQAVELCTIYLTALFEIYTKLVKDANFGRQERHRFLNIVSSADLSSPLETDILERARTALENKKPMIKTA